MANENVTPASAIIALQKEYDRINGIGQKRLVDAYYFRNKLIPNCPIEEGGIPLKDFATHQKILELYPTVDAVEVVRCKNCGHYDAEDGTCFNWFCAKVKPNDFCSYGERKDK